MLHLGLSLYYNNFTNRVSCILHKHVATHWISTLYLVYDTANVTYTQLTQPAHHTYCHTAQAREEVITA